MTMFWYCVYNKLYMYCFMSRKSFCFCCYFELREEQKERESGLTIQMVHSKNTHTYKADVCTFNSTGKMTDKCCIMCIALSQIGMWDIFISLTIFKTFLLTNRFSCLPFEISLCPKLFRTSDVDKYENKPKAFIIVVQFY